MKIPDKNSFIKKPNSLGRVAQEKFRKLSKWLNVWYILNSVSEEVCASRWADFLLNGSETVPKLLVGLVLGENVMLFQSDWCLFSRCRSRDCLLENCSPQCGAKGFVALSMVCELHMLVHGLL